ncbi:MAG: manganese catalase family protein [Lachnospiraceae bacterium]|nr:manganese catalase family protein [Lachnospiraceae bacterium]
MWLYEKRLQYPVNIKESNATLAQAIIEQYGGPNRLKRAIPRYWETAHPPVPKARLQ